MVTPTGWVLGARQALLAWATHAPASARTHPRTLSICSIEEERLSSSGPLAGVLAVPGRDPSRDGLEDSGQGSEARSRLSSSGDASGECAQV